MERRRKHLRHDLLRLDIVGDITLITSRQPRAAIYDEVVLTRSFAPRFKKRAPAKKRDRLASIVM